MKLLRIAFLLFSFPLLCLAQGNTASLINLSTNTVVAHFAVGNPGANPMSVVWASNSVAYVVNDNASTLVRLDMTTSPPTISTTFALANPGAIAINPAGTRALVKSTLLDLTTTPFTVIPTAIPDTASDAKFYSGGNRAILVSGTDLFIVDMTVSPPGVTVVSSILPSEGLAVAVNPAGTRAVVTLDDSGGVQVIDLTTSPPSLVGGPVGPSPADPLGVAISPDGTRAIYVDEESPAPEANVIDITGVPFLVNTIPIPVATLEFPSAVVFNPITSAALIATDTGVAIISPPYISISTIITDPGFSGATAFSIAVNTSGTFAIVLNEDRPPVPNTASKIDLTTNTVVSHFFVGSNPTAVAWAGNGVAYVVNDEANTLVRLDMTPSTPAITATYTFPVGFGPHALAINAAGNRALVTGDGSVAYLLNLATTPFTVADTIAIPTPDAGGVAFYANDAGGIIVNEGNVLFLDLTVTPATVTTVSLGGNQGLAVAVDHTFNQAVVTLDTGGLQLIGLSSSPPFLSGSPVGPSPADSLGVAVTPAGPTAIYVDEESPDGEANVVSIGDGATLIRTVSLSSFLSTPSAVAFNPVTAAALIAGDDGIAILNPPYTSVTTTITDPGYSGATPYSIAVNPAGTFAIVLNEDMPALSPAISCAPSPVPFGNVPIGTTSAPIIETCTNTGQAPLMVSAVTVSGAGFALTGVPALPATVQPGGQFSFDVTFTPPGPGPQAGAVTIVSDALTSPTVIPLSGNGSGCAKAAPPPALIVDKPIVPVDTIVTLTWDPPFRGFQGTYTIKFSTDGGGTFQDFASGIVGNQFAFHAQYPAGTTLVFEVVADPGCGPAGVSDPSPTVTVQVVQACPRAGDPVAQVDQAQVAVGDSWSLHWTATLPVVGGVTAGIYEIRISRDNGATFQVAGTTTGTTFTGPVLQGDLGKLIFLQVVAKPSCGTGALSYGGSNTVFFTVLPGPACEAPNAASNVSLAAAGVSPARPPSPIEYILASWSSPVGGTAPRRYGVRINGDPEVLTTFTSLILAPRGGRDPITAFVTAYSCGTLISAEVFGAGQWSPTGSLGVPRQSHTATLLSGGNVLVAGGTSTPFGPAIASAELFDPGTGGWSPTANLTTARQSHTATALSNGKVLVSGGVSAGLSAAGVFRSVAEDIVAEAQLSSAELYDPAAKTWSTTGNLGTPRAQHTATLLLNGKVLVAGGRGSGPLNTAELYDLTSGLWSSTGQLQTARLAHTATLLPNGKVLVAGGVNASGVLASAELYDPSTGAWTLTGNLGTARESQTATLLSSGKVLVSGGDDGGVALKGAELYDPAAGTWSTTGSLGTARTLHTATLLPGGAVLAAGGSVLHGPSLRSAELYDPAAGTWSSTGSLNGAHGLHSATLLPSGSVLVAGLPDAIGPERASPVAQSSTVALLLTPPGTDFTISPNPVVGQPVTFTDASNPQATGWLWIFDDGTTDSRQSPTHVFTSAGTHFVALDATNGAGSQTKVKSFVVSAAAAATASRQLASVAFDASDPVRQRATVTLGAQGSTWLHLTAAESQDTTIFLRFIGRDGALVTERRLVVSPGTEAVYDLAAWSLKGTFSLELVCDRSFSAWIVRSGRPGAKEITR